MTDPKKRQAPLEPQQALELLAARLGQALEHPEGQAERGLVRVEVPVLAPAPLNWLGAQRGVTQYYWADRDGAFAMAGIGEADVLAPAGSVDLQQVFGHMRSRLSPRYPGLRYYGGLRFSQGREKSTRWSQFTAYRFVVPRFELVQRRAGVFLACNALRSADAQARAELLEKLLGMMRGIVWTPPPSPPPLAVLRREDRPDPAGWKRMVERALDACATHHLEKVVLARETTFTARDRIDPVAVLGQLVQHSPQSFEFCFHPVEDRAFIGASPERLFRRKNVYVESEALAGTRPRGRSDAEDARLGEELLVNEKELLEHRFVLRMLREHFRRFCEVCEEEAEPRLLRLRHCQHLYTPIRGILKDTECDAALLGALHPTPAVGGTPRDRALAWIQDEEPFDRGIYAAPVGWVGYDGCEFCVAIRSALVKENLLSVYTGAGIVPGSLPAEEWAELEQKMGSFAEILGSDAE